MDMFKIKTDLPLAGFLWIQSAGWQLYGLVHVLPDHLEPGENVSIARSNDCLMKATTQQRAWHDASSLVKGNNFFQHATCTYAQLFMLQVALYFQEPIVRRGRLNLARGTSLPTRSLSAPRGKHILWWVWCGGLMPPGGFFQAHEGVSHIQEIVELTEPLSFTIDFEIHLMF